MIKFTRREKSYLIIALGELIKTRALESEDFIDTPNKDLDEFFISEKKSFRKEIRELTKLQNKIYEADYREFIHKRRNKWVD